MVYLGYLQNKYETRNQKAKFAVISGILF